VACSGACGTPPGPTPCDVPDCPGELDADGDCSDCGV
jgi:hypothetical protein